MERVRDQKAPKGRLVSKIPFGSLDVYPHTLVVPTFFNK